MPTSSPSITIGLQLLQEGAARAEGPFHSARVDILLLRRGVRGALPQGEEAFRGHCHLDTAALEGSTSVPAPPLTPPRAPSPP